MATGLGSRAAAAAGRGVGRGAVECQQRTLVALPDAMLSEVMGNLGVKCLGRASCACRCIRDTVAAEWLWTALWEGPLPDGFSNGGKAAHAALWLLAKGQVEQTRVAVCEPAPPVRTTTRRRVGDAGPAAAAFNGSSAAAAGGAGRFYGGGAGPAHGGGGGGAAAAAVVAATAGFPVHVSCMAISGGVIATAAGPDITVWDLEEAAPRARFNVSGHGSVTCLLLRHGTLLAGDNSGYLRREKGVTVEALRAKSYDVSKAGGRPLHEIRTHTDRVTAMDAFTLLPNGDPCAGYSSRAAQNGSTRSAGGGGAAGQSRRWDQGHGWGEGWPEGNQGEIRAAPPTVATSQLTPPQHGSSSGSSSSSSSSSSNSGGSASSSSYAASPSAVGGAATAVEGRGRGGGRGHGREHQGYGGSRSFGGRFGGGGGGGGSGSILGGLGEPLSRLGKRQGYAGRGQGDEPWDVAAASAAVGTLTQQQQQQHQPPPGGQIGPGEWGWEGGVTSGWDEEEDQKEEEKGWGGEGQKSWSGAGNRGRGRANGVGGGGGGRRGTQTLLVTGSDDGTAKAWDAESGRFVCVYAGHTRGVTCLQAAFTESYGPVLVTGGGDSAVIIWELATGRCLDKLETGAGLVINPGGAGPRVGCLQAYRNSIVVGEDRHVSVWSLCKGQGPRLTRASFCEHQRPIRRLELMGRWIVTCSGDYVIRLWDFKTGGCIREIGTKSGAAITSFRLSGLCLFSTSLFDASVLMTSFSPRRESMS